MKNLTSNNTHTFLTAVLTIILSIMCFYLVALRTDRALSSSVRETDIEKDQYYPHLHKKEVTLQGRLRKDQ
jgi:hypothetical protein